MTWNDVVNHCDTIDGLTPDEKLAAKDAYRYIEAKFGQSFLPLDHPFSRQIANRAPWTRKWVVEFVRMLERNSCLPNFACIRRKLRDPNSYDEGHDLIRLADALVKASFEVEFEPPLPQSVPDLGISHGNERFFIEMSDLQRSHIAKKAEDTGLWFTTTVMPHTGGMVHAGHIYKQLSSRHMKELGEILKEAAETARKEDRLCETIVDGAIEFAFAPENKQGELVAWAKPRQLEVNSMSGPPIPSDLVARVKGKIANKQRQLPADAPNVIVITSYQNFIFPVELRRILGEIEEEVYEHPHVALASLHTHWGDKQETGTARIGNHLVNVRPGAFNFTCSLILLNRFSEVTFSQNTKECLERALMNF